MDKLSPAASTDKANALVSIYDEFINSIRDRIPKFTKHKEVGKQAENETAEQAKQDLNDSVLFESESKSQVKFPFGCKTAHFDENIKKCPYALF